MSDPRALARDSGPDLLSPDPDDRAKRRSREGSGCHPGRDRHHVDLRFVFRAFFLLAVSDDPFTVVHPTPPPPTLPACGNGVGCPLL